ncbi:hypothetical protein HK104_005195 [Borealophlyctis nickersoniae]|nr:hypothetical protein HK104_005195 [Borealophlyctis nickersoniae]
MYLICQLFGSVIALGFISPVVLAPLGAAGLIFNVLFSRLFLGTPITGYDWFGTFLIVIGCAIVSTFGSGASEDRQTIDELIRLYGRPTFIVFFTIQGLFVIGSFIYIKYLEYGFGSFKGWAHGLAVPPGASTRYREEHAPLLRTNAPISPVSPSAASYRATRKKRLELIGVFYALLGGLAASETLLLAKSGVELMIVSALQSENQFHGLFSFMVLAVLVLTLFLQLYCLNRGLHYAYPVIVVPLFYTVYSCFSLINSIVYLDQLNLYSLPDLVCITTGIGIIVAGVWLLRGSQQADKPEMWDRDDPAGRPPAVSGRKKSGEDDEVGRTSAYTNGEDDVDRLLETAEAMVASSAMPAEQRS